MCVCTRVVCTCLCVCSVCAMWMVPPGLAVGWCPHFALINLFTQGLQSHQTLQEAPADLPCLPATLGGPACPPALLPAWRVLTHHPSPGRERTRQPGRTPPQHLTSAHRSPGYWCHHPTWRPPLPITFRHPSSSFRIQCRRSPPPPKPSSQEPPPPPTLPCALTDCRI